MPQQVTVDNGSNVQAPRRPCRIIHIQDLFNKGDQKTDFHLVLKINNSSPQEISLKRNENKLAVDFKEQGEEAELISRCYNIPKEGYTEEFGAQLAAHEDGLLGVRKTKMTPGPVYPIRIDQLPNLKSGTIVQVHPVANWEGPINFESSTADEDTQCALDIQLEKEGNDDEEETVEGQVTEDKAN